MIKKQIITLKDGTKIEDKIDLHFNQHPETLIGKPNMTSKGYSVISGWKKIDETKPLFHRGYPTNCIITAVEQTEEEFYARLACFS